MNKIKLPDPVSPPTDVLMKMLDLLKPLSDDERIRLIGAACVFYGVRREVLNQLD